MKISNHLLLYLPSRRSKNVGFRCFVCTEIPHHFPLSPLAAWLGNLKKKPKTTQPRSVRALFSFIRGAAIGGIVASQIIQKHFRWKFCWSSCDALPAIENATSASWCSEVYPCFFPFGHVREGRWWSEFNQSSIRKKKKVKRNKSTYCHSKQLWVENILVGGEGEHNNIFLLGEV